MSEFREGDRVRHRNMSPGGADLPMVGTVVGVEVKYIVQWDGADPHPVSGQVPLCSYAADFLSAEAKS